MKISDSDRKFLDSILTPGKKTLLDSLGIELTEISKELMQAEMPVDERTMQPMGILHGGASVALAESLASIGALLWIDTETQVAVGQEINANHIRPVMSGKVFGTAKPIHAGRGSQVWSIEIKNEAGKLTSVSRCTISIVPKRV